MVSAGINYVSKRRLHFVADKAKINADKYVNSFLPNFIEDCEKDPRFERWGGLENVRGWMGVPMITRGQVIGYITIDSHTPGAFTKNDANAAQTFAHQDRRLYCSERLAREVAGDKPVYPGSASRHRPG